MGRFAKMFMFNLVVLVITTGMAGCNFFGGPDESRETTREQLEQATENIATAMPAEEEIDVGPPAGHAQNYETTQTDEHQAIVLALLEILMPAIQEMVLMMQAGMDADEIAVTLSQDAAAPEQYPATQGQDPQSGMFGGVPQDINALIGVMVNEGFIVQFGLGNVFLLNQKLEDGSVLETIMFEAPRFINNQIGTVPIMANDARLLRWGGGILNRSNDTANPPITINYLHAENMTALEAVIRSVIRDVQAGVFMPGAWLDFGTIRSSDRFDMATGYFREELGLGMWRYWLYVAQEVPGSGDIVMLNIVLSPFHWNETQWGEHERSILAELSRHINVDLKRFAP